MFAGAINFLGVEWIDDKAPVLEQLGPVLVAGVAAFAAWLAAHTAGERHKSQLQHDSARQKEQLEHDSRRQREQLEHDSDMRQKEHLRMVLEKVLASISRTVTDVVDLSAKLHDLEEASTELDEANEGGREEARSRKLEALGVMTEGIETVTSAMTALVLDTARLRLFLPPEDPIVKSYDALVVALRAWRDSLSTRRVGGVTTSRNAEEVEEGEEARRKSDRALEAFQAACHSRFATPAAVSES